MSTPKNEILSIAPSELTFLMTNCAECCRNFWQTVGAIYTAALQAEAESLGAEPTEVW